MSEFVTKDSGERQHFATGARRDVETGKPRYDLIPLGPLRRLAEAYGRGAGKYGEDNWQKGMPFRRVYSSLLRHVFAWAEGDSVEDHLAAVVFNAFALMHYATHYPELNDMRDDATEEDAEFARRVRDARNALAGECVANAGNVPVPGRTPVPENRGR